jgi:ribonuclease Z
MPSSIDTAVFTHMHTDHITDVPDFLFLRWTSGARTPLRVFGPDGTREMIDGFLMAMRRDIQFRQAHHGDKLHPDGIKVEVTEIPATATPEKVISVDGMTIESFEVNHFPVVPAFGYRMHFEDRTVVMSGDTTFCESLLHASEGADMLVCEALNVSMLEERTKFLRALGRELQASLFEDIPSYHIPTEEIARLAATSGVGRLVLSHLIPPIASEGPEVESFVSGMSDLYRGPIHVARDGERISIEKKAEAMR